LNVHFWPEASFPLAKLVNETIAKYCHQNACPWLPCVTRRLEKKCQIAQKVIKPKKAKTSTTKLKTSATNHF
jgi:hypothetical protein